MDRQHPRDLFDVKLMMEKEGFNDAIKEGFLYCLLSGARPVNEVIVPRLQDQRNTLIKQLNGMSDQPFSYQEFEETRQKLIETVSNSMTKEDKYFLLSFKNGAPVWDKYDFSSLPSIQWKLQNINTLKETNPAKHKFLYNELESKLDRDL